MKFDSKYLLAYAFLCFDVFVMFLAYKFNMYELLLKDTTPLSISIVVIYLLSNLVCFALIYFERTGQTAKQEHMSRASWWLVQVFPAIGMFATVFGFYEMFTGVFGNIDVSNPAAFKATIDQLVNGLAISSIPTCAGIVAFILLSLKLVILNNANEV